MYPSPQGTPTFLIFKYTTANKDYYYYLLFFRTVTVSGKRNPLDFHTTPSERGMLMVKKSSLWARRKQATTYDLRLNDSQPTTADCCLED